MQVRRRQPSSIKLPVGLLYNLILIAVTATVTWMFARCLNRAFDQRLAMPGFQLDQLRLPSAVHAIKMNVVPNPDLWKGHIDYSGYHGPSKIFAKFHHPFPCFEGEKKLMLTTPAYEGILFHRPMKTGSTTMTGIVLRLVHNRGKLFGFNKCKHRSIHGSGREFDFGNRNKSRSFLFSIIREPQARALSQVFHFDISVGAHEPTDEFIRGRLLQNFNHLAYLDGLTVRNYTNPIDQFKIRHQLALHMGYDSDRSHTRAVQNGPPETSRRFERMWKGWRRFGSNFSVNKIIGDILEDYNFIAIMERMDESLVVLQMLLNLTTKEILYTRARSGGSFTNSYPPNPCKYILPTFVSPGIKEFFASKEWQEHIAPDVEFYKAVHKSLDRTIDALGRKEFYRKLASFQKAMKMAAAKCAGRVRTMCSDGGEPIKPSNTTCYIWGEGCDHDCIDELDL